jgi:hypothetical protein
MSGLPLTADITARFGDAREGPTAEVILHVRGAATMTNGLEDLYRSVVILAVGCNVVDCKPARYDHEDHYIERVWLILGTERPIDEVQSQQRERYSDQYTERSSYPVFGPCSHATPPDRMEERRLLSNKADLSRNIVRT